MATYYFLGTDGTYPTDWDIGANWNDAPDGSGSSGTIPGTLDDAVIKANCVCASTSYISSITVNSLTIDNNAIFGNDGNCGSAPIPTVITNCTIVSGTLIGIQITGNCTATSGSATINGATITGDVQIGAPPTYTTYVYNTTIQGNATVDSGGQLSQSPYTTTIGTNVYFNGTGTSGASTYGGNLNVTGDVIIGSSSSSTMTITYIGGDLIYTNGNTANITVTSGPSATKYSGYSTLYFNNNALDGDFSNPNNWWVDSMYTMQSSESPSSSTTAKIYANVSANGGSVDVLDVYGSWTIDTSITVATSANFYDSSSLSVTNGIINGTVNFYDSSTNAGGIINGTVNFYDSSTNAGNIYGDAIVHYPHTAPFYASTGNTGSVSLTLTYYGYTPRTLYLYYAMGDTNWGNIYHWWTESTHNTQATYLPLPIDDVIMESNCTSNYDGTNAAPSTVNVLTLNSGYLGINVSCDTCQVNNSASIGDILGMHASTLTVADTITFSDLSTIYGNGVVNTDIAILEDNSSLTGPGATLTANSINVYYPVIIPLDGTITGPITYFGYTYYFNDTTNSNNDGNWNTNNNWFLDSANTVAAGGPPTETYPGENVVLQSSVTTSTSGSPTAYNLTCGNQSGCPGDDPNPAFSVDGTTIVVNGLATFQTDHFCVNSSTGGILGSTGTIDGDALFKDFGTNQGGTINGLATFTLQAAENMIYNAHGGNYNGGIEFQYGKGVNGSSILSIV